jgi:hypothetical protein
MGVPSNVVELPDVLIDSLVRLSTKIRVFMVLLSHVYIRGKSLSFQQYVHMYSVDLFSFFLPAIQKALNAKLSR